jgi:hypothetical protein
MLRARDFGNRREFDETSQTALKKVFVMQLLCWRSNGICFDYVHVWLPGNHFVIDNRWPSNTQFLYFAGESERQITPDTSANFSTRITCGAGA